MKTGFLKTTISIILLVLCTHLHSQENILKNHALVSDIYILGNKTTKDVIVLRELPFKKGDLVEISRIDELITSGKNNLINLSLFNFTNISYNIIENDNTSGLPEINIMIDLEERWYYWPRIDVSLEDRNLSSWLKKPSWERITYSIGANIYNLLGYNQSLSIVYAFGYQTGFRLDYNNISIGKKGEHYIGFSLSGRYRKTENVTSEYDEPIYMKSDNVYLSRRESFILHYTYRPKLRIFNVFSVEYENKRISQDILDRNPDYWGGDNLKREGIYLGYDFISDQRDNIQYPLNGYYVGAGMRAYTDFNSSLIYSKIIGDFRYYNNFSGRWSYAFRLSAGASVKNQAAYTFDRAIGYDDIGLRGYEYYVVDGQHYITLNPTMRYNIIPTKIINLNFMPLSKFKKTHFALYGKAFFDTGYVAHNSPYPLNTLSNKFLYSYGVGVDMVTYYDITLSVDYSFNQFFKHGFYISLKSPIL